MGELFKNINKNITARLFATKLLVQHDEQIDFQWVNHLFKKLKRSHPKYFKNSVCPRPDKTSQGFVIFDTKQYRKILITDELMQYDEFKNTNNTEFNRICKTLFESYITDRSIEFEDIRLIGKLCDISIEKKGVFQDFVGHTGLFQDEKTLKTDLKCTVLRDDINIHIYFFGEDIDQNDSDEDDQKESLSVRLDFNNYNQTSGMAEGDYEKIFKFADDFIRDELEEFLQKKVFKG